MIARSSSIVLGLTFSLGLTITNLRDAEACGGCFHPEPTVVVTGSETTSVVTDHRMVFKISQDETILWDQVRYTGAPEEFAWVLPVREGAKVELARDEFIASLDAQTKTTVKGPTRVCRDPNSGQSATFRGGDSDESSGCGSTSYDSAFASGERSPNGGGTSVDAGSENEQVDVISQAVIGPYQSVTLRAKNGEGIAEWLSANKFQIPDNVKPTIEAYTKEGFDFIALRLRPGQGVQAMRPVRVVTPGADTSLPLRMVAAGIGAKVGLTLWVIAEGRYSPQNFPTATVDDSALVWDAKVGKSNLVTLQATALAQNDSRTWLTEVAGRQSLEGNVSDLFSSDATVYSAYMRACSVLAPRTEPCNANDLPESQADGGAGDAGPSKCTKVVSGCDGYDDLEVARRGLSSSDIWVTRLRADLPATALATDFTLTASSQSAVAKLHTTNTYADPNDDPCPDGVYRLGTSSSSSSSSGSNSAAPPEDDDGCTCRIQKKSTPSTWLLIGLTAFVASRIARKKR